ncbi:MAG: helix-turn-helix transcriptional regulator [Saprospirales bacterium]|nr:helix-turn-helix transcriptional regulator [Saprospirales bacterium]
MMLAAKIEDAMTAKNIGKKQLAEMMGQRPSVITKWLSGKHNFTVDTLTDIQRVLGVRLLALEEKTHPEITFKFTIESADQKSQEVSRTIEQVFSSIPLLHDILKAPTTTIRLQQNIPQA